MSNAQMTTPEPVAAWPDLIPELGAWVSEVRGQLIPNQLLGEMTTLRVGGPAQLLDHQIVIELVGADHDRYPIRMQAARTMPHRPSVQSAAHHSVGRSGRGR